MLFVLSMSEATASSKLSWLIEAIRSSREKMEASRTFKAFDSKKTLFGAASIYD
jgi:hypothetical protein